MARNGSGASRAVDAPHVLHKPSLSGKDDLRTDFIPVSDYLSADFLKLEYERMWNKAWQIACREEEIPEVGNYVTYEIGNQSFIIIRTASDRIQSFYNVCLHRGRRLLPSNSNGNATRFQCPYHGWRWKIDGAIERVLDRQDWNECQDMQDDDLHMRETPLGVWGGFVFISMNPDAEPLEEFLDPVPEFLDCFEFGKMRYRWNVSVKAPCNWKAGLEAFGEGYHVYSTHPQWPQFIDDVTRSATYGKHGMFGYPTALPFGQPSTRLNKPPLEDVRENLIAFYDDLNTTLAAIYSERATEAVRRLRTEVPKDAPHMEILFKMYQFIREACEACGAGWPDISFEQMAKAGTDWTIFPNIAILMQPDAALCYRLRPLGDDPDWCIFDVWSLQRYAPGAEPKLARKIHHGDDDWKRIGDISPVLLQDFSNMAGVQQGMKSYGFPGCRTNPLQESTIPHHHRVLRQYLYGDQ